MPHHFFSSDTNLKIYSTASSSIVSNNLNSSDLISTFLTSARLFLDYRIPKRSFGK